MKIKIPYLIALVVLCCFAEMVFAQSYSYVYIQGDKETPFYVKYQNEMMPRYGKNYSVIPKLNAGPITITILFEQRKYPEATFQILIPENGERSFMLSRKDDKSQLYDLEQNRILVEQNRLDEDQLPVKKPAPLAVVTNTNVEKNTTAAPTKRQENTAVNNEDLPLPVVEKTVLLKKKEKKSNSKKEEGTLVFMEDVVLPNNQAGNSDISKQKDGEFATASKEETNIPSTTNTAELEEIIARKEEAVVEDAFVVTNPNCGTAITEEEYAKILAELKWKTADEKKLDYLKGQYNNCYRLKMAEEIAENLESDAAKYSFLMRVYPHIIDQGDAMKLGRIFKTYTYSNAYMEMIAAKKKQASY